MLWPERGYTRTHGEEFSSRGAQVETIKQLRALMRVIDPGRLTHSDRADLLDLIQAAFDASTARKIAADLNREF